MPFDVLLVEDNAGDALLIRQILLECSPEAKLHIARDGEQAIQMLTEPHFTSELIILDLNIPRVSGLGVLERVSRRDAPIVIFSSSWNEREINKALALGAQEFVRTPMDIQDFMSAVSHILDKWTPSSRHCLPN